MRTRKFNALRLNIFNIDDIKEYTRIDFKSKTYI